MKYPGDPEYSPADEDMPGYEMADPRPGEDDADQGFDPCECCGGPPGCGCLLDDVCGNDPETGPWSGTWCDTHGRQV